MHRFSTPKPFRLFLLLSIFLLAVWSPLAAQTLLERIKALPDIISVEKMEQNPFFSEAYVVNVKQPIDHQHPDRGYFPQRVVVSHLSYDRPVVFITEGYGGGYAIGSRYLNELCIFCRLISYLWSTVILGPLILIRSTGAT